MHSFDMHGIHVDSSGNAAMAHHMCKEEITCAAFGMLHSNLHTSECRLTRALLHAYDLVQGQH